MRMQQTFFTSLSRACVCAHACEVRSVRSATRQKCACGTEDVRVHASHVLDPPHVEIQIGWPCVALQSPTQLISGELLGQGRHPSSRLVFVR